MLYKTYMLSFCLLMTVAVKAQQLVVESVNVAGTDLSASVHQRNTELGKTCALVKVLLPVEGARFEGDVQGDVANKAGEYWVYMPDGSTRLTVLLPSIPALTIIFSEYGIPALQGKLTYEIVMYQIRSNEQSAIETCQVGGVPFKMVHVEGGTFLMGATEGQGRTANSYYEIPVHEVTVSSFMIGETEVTQQLWKAVMGRNPSKIKGDDMPVTNVSWDDCQKFIKKLNSKTGLTFRLPTEAEWEFAARGGVEDNDLQYSGSDDVNTVAVYADNSGKHVQVVKSKTGNDLGIYDMSGNVKEWCQDIFRLYTKEKQVNPLFLQPVDDNHTKSRVARGGSYCDESTSCRVCGRVCYSHDYKSNNLGFRIVLQ